MIDAGSRFAGASDPAGVRGRLLLGGSPASLVLDSSSDGSGASALNRAISVRALAALVLLGAIGVLAAVVASPAHAAFIHKPAGTFDLFSGQAAKAGVDEETGDIYVLPRFSGQIEKFDSEGNPSNFTGLPGPNESQSAHFEGEWFSGDTFTLTCPNAETTAAIVWSNEQPTLAANMKAALEAKCGGTISISSGPFNPVIRFEGTFAETNVPQMTCTKVTASGSCNVTTEQNGGTGTNKLNAACNGGCYQITVDNTGGPNQGVIYVSSAESMTTCCPGGQSVPNPSGGIHAYLPSGEKTHSTYQGVPVDPHPFEFEGEFPPEPLGGGGLYTRSQETFAVHACGVAVDEDGDLIIAHGDSNQEFAYIDKLGLLPWATNDTQEGTLLGTLNSDTSNPCRVQVDSAGNVYYQVGSGFGGGELQFSSGPIKKYPPNFHAPSGTAQIPPELKDPSTLVHAGPDVSFAFDSEDNLYGLRPSGPPRVQKVDQSGSVTETFGSEEFLQPGDVAVNKATGTVYVTDGSFEAGAKDVHVFKAFTVPNSITEQFSATTQTSGILSGEVDLAEPGEEVTNCEFEYTTEALYIAKEFGEATKIPCDEGTTFTANESVSTETTGLTLEEPYMFRLVTENPNGASNGTVHKFVPHAVINLTTKPATGVAPRSATLNGSFNGNGDGTEYFFEYGHGPAGVYTATTPTLDAGEPNGDTPLSAPISNLLLETTYHFRVVAINGTGTSKGFDQSFTTPSAVAGLTTEAASDIGQETITLNGKFTGDGHDTKYFFEYGPTKDYGLESSKFDAGSTFGMTLVPAEISTFYGYTTYHYRVVAENEFGTTYGKDVTFSTEPAPKPIVTETGIDELTPTTATVSAMVAPNRWDASWLFEWGETASYGSFTESEPILAGITTEFFPIDTTIEGLEPATLYHFRAVAFNFTGVTTGPDLTFRTPSKPSIESATSSAVGQTTAHLSARVIANSSPTGVHFEFGPTTGYGSSTTSSAIGSETLARESAIDLTGLTPGTTYHFRAVGTNEFGVTAGSDQTFTTLPGPQPPPPPTAGNKKCPKGKVKKHGKCVPKHKKNKKKKNKRHG